MDDCCGDIRYFDSAAPVGDEHVEAQAQHDRGVGRHDVDVAAHLEGDAVRVVVFQVSSGGEAHEFQVVELPHGPRADECVVGHVEVGQFLEDHLRALFARELYEGEVQQCAQDCVEEAVVIVFEEPRLVQNRSHGCVEYEP